MTGRPATTLSLIHISAEEKSDEERNPESLVFDVGDMMAAVSLMPAPVPNGEAEECAKNKMCIRDR